MSIPDVKRVAIFANATPKLKLKLKSWMSRDDDVSGASGVNVVRTLMRQIRPHTGQAVASTGKIMAKS